MRTPTIQIHAVFCRQNAFGGYVVHISVPSTIIFKYYEDIVSYAIGILNIKVNFLKLHAINVVFHKNRACAKV